IFQVMLNPTVGIINKLIGTNQNLLTNPTWSLVVIGILTGWLNSGMNFLYFSSGLASIDDSLYASASIDGANGFQKFNNITITSLCPSFLFDNLHNVINY